MKTFKNLYEKWFTSYIDKSYSGRITSQIDIYINPNMGELKKLQRENNGNSPRGFIAPNGKVYFASTSIHPFIMRNLKKEISAKRSLPIVIYLEPNPIYILMGDYRQQTIFAGDKNIGNAVKVIQTNSWVKRTFKDYEIWDDYGRKITE